MWLRGLACVLQLSPYEDRVKVTLLHPPGPSNSNPKSEHIVTVTVKDILTVVDPRTRTGRVYTLSKKEMKAATEKFLQCNELNFTSDTSLTFYH